jgi:hypothetical protein
MFFFTLQGEKEHTKNAKYYAAAGESWLWHKSYRDLEITANLQLSRIRKSVYTTVWDCLRQIPISCSKSMLVREKGVSHKASEGIDWT